MAGGKKNKKKTEQQGGNTGLMNGVMILDLDDYDDDGRYLDSVPAGRQSAGNEFGPQGEPQSNESARLEAQKLNENKGAVKDQNGPAPQQPAPRQNEEEISEEELANVSYELDKDVWGLPIISNEIPRNVVAKVMARRAQNRIGGNISNDNQIRNVEQPGNANAGNKALAPVQAPQQQEPVQAPQQEPLYVVPQSLPGVPAPSMNSDEDMVAEAPKKKRVKKASKSADAAPQNIMNAAPGVNVEGINQVSYNTFQPYQKPRTDWSKTAQVNYALWRGVGNTIGKASVLPATIVGKGLGITGGIKKVAHVKAELGQQNRTHRAIPGREGQNFNPNKTSGADILADFRRVPTVWSYLTAGKAVDQHGNDLDPKVTVYVEQPKTGSSRTMRFTEAGHTMLGIEYTRASKITGQKERYNIKYGFYPGEDFVNGSGTMMMMQGAEIPGRLVDDAKHTYDISKTYPATRPQIERIAKASEAYTERGGYSMYRRNCTTFVRDMFRAGGIATDQIDRIFTEELIRFNSAGNLGHVMGTSWNNFLDTDVQRRMGNLTTKNDMSYQGQGNKKVTKADFDRYRATKNSAGVGQKGYAPAATGENLRLSKDAEGTFGSYKYTPQSLKANENTDAKTAFAASMTDLQGAIAAEGRALYRAISGIMTEDQQRAAGSGFYRWMHNLEASGIGEGILRMERTAAANLAKLKLKDDDPVPEAHELLKPEDVKTAYASVSDEKEEISRFYQTALGSDSRVNTEVMNLLSTMQISLRLINDIYLPQDKAKAYGDLGTIREDMTSMAYEVVLDDNRKIKMTPTHYESYLQIFKTPEAAVMGYKRYLDLLSEHNRDQQNMHSIRFKLKWSGKKQKEWEKVSEIERLANAYDQSHRDMLEKDGFTQNDIDYVFQMRKMERSGAVMPTGDMYTKNATASMTYMAIFFDKIFGGMRATARRKPEFGGVPNNADMITSAMWMNDYLTKKTQAKMKGMTAILRGIMHAYTNPTRALVKGSFRTYFMNSYLKRVFTDNISYGRKVYNIGAQLDPIFSEVIDNPRMTFTSTIEGIIRSLLEEHNKPAALAGAEKNKKLPENLKKKKKKK